MIYDTNFEVAFDEDLNCLGKLRIKIKKKM